jgi:hypothetical protein
MSFLLELDSNARANARVKGGVIGRPTGWALGASSLGGVVILFFFFLRFRRGDLTDSVVIETWSEAVDRFNAIELRFLL